MVSIFGGKDTAFLWFVQGNGKKNGKNSENTHFICDISDFYLLLHDFCWGIVKLK